MGWKTLTDTSGTIVHVDEGESATLKSAVLYDASDSALTKAAIVTCTVTLLDAAIDGTVINSRDDQDILDTNGGTLTDVDSEVTLELALGPSDNPINDSTVEAGQTESHYLIIEWTWSGGTGSQVYEIQVMKKPHAA